MKYRTKLYFLLIAVAFISTLVGLTITYLDIKTFIRDEFESQAMSIAATTAILIDGDKLKTINTESDRDTENYKTLRNELRKVRETNRRSDVYINYIYTLKPSKEEPGAVVMAVSAADTPEETIPIGAVYRAEGTESILQNKDHPYSPDVFIHDQWGVWLRGFAPVYDSQGQYVATLGIDINAAAVLKEKRELLYIALLSLSVSILLAVVIAALLSKLVTRSLATLVNSAKEIGKGEFDHKTILKTHDEFHDLAEEMNTMAKRLKERERLKRGFARYVSSYILEKTLKSDQALKLEGERRKVTILFCDIRNFTHLAEVLPPEEVVLFLNRFFEKMIEVVFHHQGTLDKLLGDGMMVEFGAPIDDQEQEKHAINAAIEMQKELKKLSDQAVSEGRSPIKMGIGIHTGIAVVGNIGSDVRMDYTAVGDAVNVAARLETASKDFHVPILVSENTYKNAQEHYPFTYQGEISLKGREEKIKVYSLNTQES